ncbi:LOW QUALITY PROTEIN: hypothetical protein ACHAWF_018857 [Thalassiosira exigua]
MIGSGLAGPTIVLQQRAQLPRRANSPELLLHSLASSSPPSPAIDPSLLAGASRPPAASGASSAAPSVPGRASSRPRAVASVAPPSAPPRSRAHLLKTRAASPRPAAIAASHGVLPRASRASCLARTSDSSHRHAIASPRSAATCRHVRPSGSTASDRIRPDDRRARRRRPGRSPFAARDRAKDGGRSSASSAGATSGRLVVASSASSATPSSSATSRMASSRRDPKDAPIPRSSRTRRSSGTLPGRAPWKTHAAVPAASSTSPSSLAAVDPSFPAARAQHSAECSPSAASRDARTFLPALRAASFAYPRTAASGRARASHRASAGPSDRAALAPCPLNGLMAWKASPATTTREGTRPPRSRARRRRTNASGSRSTRDAPQIVAGGVRATRSGIGACHVPHSSRARARRVSGEASARDRAAGEEEEGRGKESCHMVLLIRYAEDEEHVQGSRQRLLLREEAVAVGRGPFFRGRRTGRDGEVSSRHGAVHAVGADEQVRFGGGSVLEAEQHRPRSALLPLLFRLLLLVCWLLLLLLLLLLLRRTLSHPLPLLPLGFSTGFAVVSIASVQTASPLPSPAVARPMQSLHHGSVLVRLQPLVPNDANPRAATEALVVSRFLAVAVVRFGVPFRPPPSRGLDLPLQRPRQDPPQLRPRHAEVAPLPSSPASSSSERSAEVPPDVPPLVEEVVTSARTISDRDVLQDAQGREGSGGVVRQRHAVPRALALAPAPAPLPPRRPPRPLAPNSRRRPRRSQASSARIEIVVPVARAGPSLVDGDGAAEGAPDAASPVVALALAPTLDLTATADGAVALPPLGRGAEAHDRERGRQSGQAAPGHGDRAVAVEVEQATGFSRRRGGGDRAARLLPRRDRAVGGRIPAAAPVGSSTSSSPPRHLLGFREALGAL